MAFYDKVLKVRSAEIINIHPNETTSFEKPTIIGCFSIDNNRKYVPNASNLMYYYSRDEEIKANKLHLDLNEGIENVVRKVENKAEKLDHLLTFIENNQDKLSVLDEETKLNKKLDADFVCYRGLLTQIMCSMHLKEEYSICVSKYKGVIYLYAHENKPSFNVPKTEVDKYSSWGFKFEQYMLTSKPGERPDTSKSVHESEEFCCVYKSKLGAHKILYGAEVDGIFSKTPVDESTVDWNKLEFVELKTSKRVFQVNEDRSLKMYKFIKWWAQSFLVNIQQLHCGFRDRRGIVREIVPFFVKDLPKLSSNLWNWRTCLNFCNIFLNIIKDMIPDELNDRYTVWKFDWKPNLEYFQYQEFPGKSLYTFLPEWYNLK